MKKIKIFGLASTLILAGAAGFTSCSSDSADPIGGGTGVAGQVVKTQFAINIPYGGNSSTNQAKKVTRMTADNTQQTSTAFRGIKDLVLLTFTGEPGTASFTTAGKDIYIGDDDDAYNKDNFRRLYRDIQIPTGTTWMVLHGRAKRATGDTDFKVGKIKDISTIKTEKVLDNIKYQLDPIAPTADFSTNAEAQAIINALKLITDTKVVDNGNDIVWAEIGDTKYDDAAQPTWITKSERMFLQARYKSFIELKAGSKNSVVNTINSLITVLQGETAGSTVDPSKILTAEIVKNCKDAITQLSSLTFPENLNLPDGVARIDWNSTGKTFAYKTAENAPFNTGNTINYKKICYPAELSYFVKSTTMISTVDMSKVGDFPDYDKWIKNPKDVWTGTSFTEGAIANNTKTVALKEPAQYGVAVLESTVKCKTTTLEDNAHNVDANMEDQKINIGSGFPVTAIMVGGQPKTVDWKFEPATGEAFDHTIYDKEMNGTITAGTTASTPNYTLVFDNNNATSKSVFVTIELTNNTGQAFYGQQGIIPKDAKFYLVGTLDPEATETITGGKPAGVDRVFVKDFKTTANFTIKDLKSAYNCIPDLRSSGINIGLAVDLKWEQGITFDVEL